MKRPSGRSAGIAEDRGGRGAAGPGRRGAVHRDARSGRGAAEPDERSRRLLLGIRVAAAVAAAAGLVAAYLAAGPSGMAAASTAIAVLAILAARAALPAGEGRPRNVRNDRPRQADVSQEDFPGYRKIYANVGWAASSRRHYDHGVRPLLARLLAARLAERYGLDARARPQQARALIGADLWPLVDPSAPPSNDSDAPGVSLASLARVVSRLEEL